MAEKIGLERGRREGLKDGRKLEKLELAKKMKEEGIPIETIIKITELTKQEILNQ